MAKQVEDVVTDDRVESLKTVKLVDMIRHPLITILMNLRKSTIKK